jgi:hypothetical protein
LVYNLLDEWDSRGRKYHYIQQQGPKGESLISGRKNVVNTPSVYPEKVYLPPLHIKLGQEMISSRQWIK